MIQTYKKNMDKGTLNLVCCAIALSGGNEELIKIVRSLNEGVNYENFNEILEFVENKFVEVQYEPEGKNKLQLTEKEFKHDNWNYNCGKTEEDGCVIIKIDDKEIITYHKSLQHSQKP